MPEPDWERSPNHAEWMRTKSCRICKHRLTLQSCAAYDFIPMALYTNISDHLVPRPGDRGIQFEPGESPWSRTRPWGQS